MSRTATILLAGLFLLPMTVAAQELDPRAYTQGPIGVNVLVAGYGSTSGDVVFDASSAISDVNADVDMATVGAGRVFGLFGRQSSLTLGVPYAWGDVSGNVGENRQSVSRTGLGDPRLRFGMLLFGGPALERREFATAPRGPVLGASLLVSAPLGEYIADKLINIGTNRWAFKPEIGFTYPAGRWQFDAFAGVWLFENNNNYYGGHRREQDPIGSYQVHVSYTIRPGLWASVDATHYNGGTTALDGVPNPDRQGNTRVGATVSVPFGQGLSLKLSYSEGAVVRVGGDFSSIGLALQYAWFD